ncbi:transcriptional regulator [Enterobacter ludwigii]|uniref:transcriptional regulator n=1 Tax=Enterobacter ludwigii TaxID=299767 RepID=UPI003BEEF96F
MSKQKESNFSFEDGRKESISTRLRQLIGERSVRAAANDWGLSFSTLNNYLTRGTEPSLNVALKIANVEHVSVEWIATGESHTQAELDKPAEKTNELLRSTWISTFEFMSKAEVEALLKIIIRGGARGLIKLAEHEASLEEEFMLLPTELKERAIALVDAHVEAKRGASEGSDIGTAIKPTSDTKQAS